MITYGDPALVWNRKTVRTFVPFEWPPSVYRIWRETELLYVGASTDLRARLLRHLLDDRFTEATHVSVEQFRNPTAMHRAERKAVGEENPTLDCGPVRRHGSWGKVQS